MRQRGPLIAAGAGVLVIILVMAFMVAPRVSAIHSTKDELATATAKQATLQAQLDGLKVTEAHAEAIRTQLELLDAAVPANTQLPDLIRMLNDTADQSAVTFMSVNPGAPITVSPAVPEVPSATPSPGETVAPPVLTGTTSGTTLPVGISVVPMTITVEGTYFAVDEYLFRLETLPRISKVTTVTLAGGSAYPQLVLTLTVNFYTTDTSTGPGSEPGSQANGGAAPVVPAPLPSASPSGSVPTPTGSSSG